MDNIDDETKAAVMEFYKEAAVSAEALKKKRSEEEQLLSAFHKNPSVHTFTPLYQSYKPLIMKAASINMIRSPLPESAHMAFAAQNFLNAVQTYDPKKGAFGSHMFGQVRDKGKRLNYKYQNIGYIPEDRTSKYGHYQRAVAFLREELGREPSTIEIADEMHWPVKKVELLREEDKKDLVLDEIHTEVHPLTRSNKVAQIFHDINYELTPEHSVVLEHAFGLNGRPAFLKPNGGPDIGKIMGATKLPEKKVRNALRTISRKYREHRGEALVSAITDEAEAED